MEIKARWVTRHRLRGSYAGLHPCVGVDVTTLMGLTGHIEDEGVYLEYKPCFRVEIQVQTSPLNFEASIIQRAMTNFSYRSSCLPCGRARERAVFTVRSPRTAFNTLLYQSLSMPWGLAWPRWGG